jgi:PAS domain S-box-containing protein
MFQDRRTTESRVVLWITIGLLAVMVLATGMTVWLIAEVRKGQVALQAIIRGGVAEDIQRLGTLPRELRWQLVFTILVLLVLMVSAFVLAAIVRAYMKNRAALRDIKLLAGDILASMDQGVITTDRAGYVTSVNPHAQQLLGIGAASEGRPLAEVSGNAAPLVDASNWVLQTGRALCDQDFGVIRNGHQLRLRADCHVLRDNQHEVIGTVLHVRDVTESTLIEERMRRMERFMGLGTLAAGLHHEIKNPLSALSLHVQLLEEKLNGQADDEVAETLNVLRTEVSRIAGVLENFRDYVSSDKLSRTGTDVAGLLRQTVELVRPQAQQQHVEIQAELPENGVPHISADSARLEQVALNLVLNALHEMPQGGTLSLSVRAAGREQVVVRVGDTGPGIPEGIRGRIFDPYFTTRSDGSGMGLALCDKIVRQHGGQIDVLTGTEGTVFEITLPVEVD